MDALRRAGLRRINVSIDSLQPERFRAMTQRGDLAPVLEGLAAAKAAGLAPIKINAVIEKGVNDDEVLDLVEFAREHGFGIRFIEYMDVGNANHWESDRLVSKQKILATIRQRYAIEEKGRHQGSAPSVDYQFADGTGDLGVIASVTEPFCTSCTPRPAHRRRPARHVPVFERRPRPQDAAPRRQQRRGDLHLHRIALGTPGRPLLRAALGWR